MNKKCRKCHYYCFHTQSCDYMLMTGERRGCPVVGCTRFATSRSILSLTQHYAGKTGLSERDKMMLELYEQGMIDSQIAERVGLSRGSVQHWRAKMGLSCQKDLAGGDHENRDN